MRIVSVASALVELADPISKSRFYRWTVRVTFADGTHADVDDPAVVRQMSRVSSQWVEARKTGANVIPRDPTTAVTKEDEA